MSPTTTPEPTASAVSAQSADLHLETPEGRRSF